MAFSTGFAPRFAAVPVANSSKVSEVDVSESTVTELNVGHVVVEFLHLVIVQTSAGPAEISSKVRPLTRPHCSQGMRSGLLAIVPVAPCAQLAVFRRVNDASAEA